MLPQATVLFRTLLWNASSDAGARATFQQFITELVTVQFPQADEVAGPSGSDWGIDTYVGRLDTSIMVWQSKFFLEWSGESQRNKVRSSFQRLITQATTEGFTVTAWTLCVPCVLPPAERRWFDTWAMAQEHQHHLNIRLWSAVHLRHLLIRDDAAALRQRYFPPAGPAPADRTLPLVRVADVDPRRLGVHAAITSADSTDPPPYISRDIDRQLRDRLTDAAGRGGFILLLGGSCVGKTRTLYEAVRAVVPQWSLLRPAPDGDLRARLSSPPPQTVIWLDELQRFLTGPQRLTADVIRDALDHAAIIVATLWPDEYHPRLARTHSDRDNTSATHRELLELAHVEEVPSSFSPRERRNATELARRDARIQIAVDTPDHGITQILAAGPALVRAWLHPPDTYSRALITAAVDARRLGWTSPLPRNLLTDLVPAYLSPRERAAAPPDWLDRSLTYATTVLLGATAVLDAVAEHMSAVTGYTVTDYVLQHGRRTRRTERLPTAAWQALTTHIHDREDAERLADSAYDRGLYRHAEPLYRYTASRSRSWQHPADRLADIYERQGRIDEIVAFADSLGSWIGEIAISEILQRAGRPDTALQRLQQCDRDNMYVRWRLAEVHASVGDIDQALDLLESVMTDSDDDPDMRADTLRADLLVTAGRIDDLRARATGSHGDDWCAVHRLVRYYRDTDQCDEALDLLHDLVKREETWADDLVRVLAEAGRLDEVAAIHRFDVPEESRYEDLSWSVSPPVTAQLLADHGRIDLLCLYADEGDLDAAGALAEHLATTAREEQLRQRAVNGDHAALLRYSLLLADRGNPVDALALYVAHGGTDPWHHAELLACAGRLNEASALLNAIPEPADQWLASEQHHQRILTFSARHGQLDAIRRLAYDGDEFAAELLTTTLATQGQLAQLRTEVDAGTYTAVDRLAEALQAQGRITEANYLRRFGFDPDTDEPV
ncbi:tetratricopeptide repeat protein [Actinoplanes sp. NPDC020271]|uniref:tetratricopeptide repeat protein n=1 Tax=Actinoplanes sp. NPDC020271 TaxID=3363896 RepID=UPI0037A887A9